MLALAVLAYQKEAKAQTSQLHAVFGLHIRHRQRVLVEQQPHGTSL
jgi:hypothetical protein